MELEVIKMQPNYVEFVLKGERHTLPNLLKSYLLEDPKVEFVSYMLEHPLGNDSKFVLRTKDKPVSAVIANALGSIEADFGDFEKALKKAAK